MASIEGNSNVAHAQNGKNENAVEEVKQFLTGDIVWVKIRTEPLWWPAQIHDRDHCSALALADRVDGDGRLLVALYGNAFGAWCLPSAVVPFVENFERFSADYASLSCEYLTSGFPRAVRDALDEVARLVQLEKVCRCVPEDRRGGLGSYVVQNAGLRPGVLVPEVDMNRLCLPVYEEPHQVLAKVAEFAEVGTSTAGLVDAAVLKGWVTAFNRFKGYRRYELQSYSEPVLIEGLEHKNKRVNIVVKIDPVKISEDPAGGHRTEAPEEETVARTEEESENGSVTRRRKKSKFLCHPYFQPCEIVKRRKQVTDSPPTRSSSVDEQDSSVRDFVSDARAMKDRLDATIAILKKNNGNISAEVMSSLREEFGQLMEQVEVVHEKVELCAAVQEDEIC